MNILFVITKFPASGGTETVTRLLSNEFISRGHKVYVCCFVYRKADIFVSEQIKILQFPQKGCSSQNIQFLNKILIDEDINVIINQEYPVETCILCSKAKIGTKAKLISVHHFSLLMNPYAKIGFLAKIIPTFLVYKLKKHRELKRRSLMYRYSDAYVFLSQKFIEQYKKLEPRKNLDKLRAIANPLENHCKKITDFKTKNKTIIFVARILEKEKRPSIVLDMWKKIYGKHPDWNLIFIGDGQDLQSLKEKAKNIPRIEFTGFKDPSSYFERASILLQTSAKDFEGFGMVLVEAQQYGCVPIAMDSYISLKDIITDGENGLIVPNDNIDAFAEKTELLIINIEFREKLAVNGMETCKKFSTDKIADKWENLFMELLS